MSTSRYTMDTSSVILLYAQQFGILQARITYSYFIRKVTFMISPFRTRDRNGKCNSTTAGRNLYLLFGLMMIETNHCSPACVRVSLATAVNCSHHTNISSEGRRNRMSSGQTSPYNACFQSLDKRLRRVQPVKYAAT
jgi:hypothetical protein